MSTNTVKTPPGSWENGVRESPNSQKESHAWDLISRLPDDGMGLELDDDEDPRSWTLRKKIIIAIFALLAAFVASVTALLLQKQLIMEMQNFW